MAEVVARMCSKRFFKKFRNIHRKIPASESLLNEVIVLQLAILHKKRLQHRRLIPVNFAKFSRFF